MKKLPVGRDNFETIIEENFYYVDKTKVIEQILDQGAYVTLFPRPRRFGKSLLVSMVDAFFNVEKKEKNKTLFNELYISKTKYSNKQGNYPVIKLNFKNFQNSNWENMYLGIKEEIRQLYQSKIYIKEILEEKEIELYDKYLCSNANEEENKQALKNMSVYVERYFGKKPILLIDEYDVPIQNGFTYGFYDEIVSFIKSFFNNSLKSNDSIEFAIMTGVLRVSKESIFSDLNNIDIYSILNKEYDEYFGFTEAETSELLEYYGLSLNKEVKNMYDGYIFGNVEIYNPWSIVNYANRKEMRPYWVNTSADELIKDLFNKAKNETTEMIEKLLLEKEIHCKYNEKITFLDLNNVNANNAVDIASNFLLMSGYLTRANKNNITDAGYLSLKIPNNEVKTVFAEVISNWVIYGMNITNSVLYDLSNSLERNNKAELEIILNNALNHMSIYDSQESFYHGYTLGLFANFLNKSYIVKSNREGGNGRFDIYIRKKDNSLGIIVEFKVAKTEEELENVAEKGLEQINQKEYYKELEVEQVENINTYCVAFYKKKCIVK